uniref:Uncharacterized protein n=1 Tax=viral metagenome TaxID=1070528 RepID=A0A6M3KY86_9ZZZZ
MIESAKQMRQRHQQELNELQAICPHTEGEWMPYCWAPGHYSGDIKVCKFCEKILERKPYEAVSHTLTSTGGSYALNS